MQNKSKSDQESKDSSVNCPLEVPLVTPEHYPLDTGNKPCNENQ